jgi:hypothetical protein
MATEQAVTAVVTTPTPADLADQYADALAGEYDREIDQSRDETKYEALEHAREEQRARTIVAKLSSENATAIWRRCILRTPLLTSAEKSFLSALLEPGRRLANIFPSAAYVGRFLSITTQRVYQLRASCIRKGFLRLWSLTTVREDEEGFAEFRAGDGYQLLLPPGVITRHADGWVGPADWSHWCAKW